MKKRRNGWARAMAISLIVFAALLIGGWTLLDVIDGASGTAQTELVRDAVRSAILTCYAVEGAYPSDLAYLEQNYGLAYDKERYIVSYDAFASNVMPEVRVLERGAGA